MNQTQPGHTNVVNQPQSQHQLQPLALLGATVVDGTGSPPRPDTTVVLRAGRIESVGPRTDLVPPDDAEVRHVHRRWILPGLLDAHAHMESAADLRALLEWGVTAFRNPAAPLPTQSSALGQAPTPGPTSTAPPLHAVRAGPPLDYPPSSLPRPCVVEVTTADEVRTAVRSQAAAGVDLIKLYVRLPPDLVRAAVTQAHHCGLPALGDLALTSWTDAARAGIDFLSHAMPRHPSLLPADLREAYLRDLSARRIHPLKRWFDLVDLDGPEIREMIRALRDHSVGVDPTLVGVEVALGGPDAPAKRAVWSKVLGLVSRLRTSGVSLLVGTDAPRPGINAGESLHRELTHLVDAGFSEAEVLSMATAHNAAALGLAHSHGTITPGRRADLLVLSADPLAHLEHLADIEEVNLAGVAQRRP